ncbi:fasciclin domain-containing protein [Nodosilinea sp. LEGE 06152]|uniref:fasciclin domain-containing protein n=1 Tax=Nodosilinea sp. LEGE 06152 TaxID=2777966 RepID=UPI00187E6EBB|nr:fasciclin domain-containing protein [Nodosilinea sp. LEGE 06152]MBE9155784.1 fasciclin domain-containing protein [Nodosilinea sp. LEGE 06152]
MAIKRSSQAKRWLTGFASIGAAALLAACGAESEPTAVDTAPQAPVATEEPATDSSTATDGETVADVAASSEEFSTLAQAIEAADLTEALAASGPITLFAPTNEAFEALPEGTLDELLLPENQDLLRQVLTYHVVQEEVAAADATSGEVSTAAGTPLTLEVDEASGDVMVNEAMVVEPDIQASNGIIHGIDQVILPPDLAL